MTAARTHVYASLNRIALRWYDTGTALRRALPELGRGELAVLCLYLAAGYAVRGHTTRETFTAVAGIAFDHVADVLTELGLAPAAADRDPPPTEADL